jgi:heme-degrading monooxygenase HmoA
MYTRLFYGTIQPGKFAEAFRLLEDFSHKVAQQKGYALGQLLQSGDDIVGITSWHTREDLAAYADSELARELFRSITPLFLGVPTVRTYEVKLDFTDGVGKKK